MNPERLKQIIDICNKYQRTGGANYYTLFDLDPSMDFDQIQSALKKEKLNILFHPDQLNYIPNSHKQAFMKVSNLIPKIFDTFSSKSKKEEYDKSIMESMEKQKNYEEKNLEVPLQQAVINNAVKYGWKQTIAAIIQYVNTGNPKGFTRDGDVRKIVEEVGTQKFADIIYNSSYPDLKNNRRIDMEQIIMNYITDMFTSNNMLHTQMSVLENACATTCSKYNTVQASRALAQYSTYGNAKGFTSDNGARNNVQGYINKQDIDFIIKVALNKNRLDNYSNSYTNTKNHSVQYVSDMFIKDVVMDKSRGHDSAPYR